VDPPYRLTRPTADQVAILQNLHLKDLLDGGPDPAHVSTSQNLTMRMSMRRFTRLTNAFSKEGRESRGGRRLHFMNYNFCRIHQTLRVTPAMAAGVTARGEAPDSKIVGDPVFRSRPCKRGKRRGKALFLPRAHRGDSLGAWSW
jgi:hypothetical protein